MPAAGAGLRLGGGTPKALRLLAGEPLLVHAVRGLRAVPEVGPVAVAAPQDAVAEVTALLGPYDVLVVAGGSERRESVAAALSSMPTRATLVLVHDSARCLTPPDVVRRVVAALRAGARAVVPVRPVADTVKRVHDGVVVDTPDRSVLRAVQTPQGFTREVLHAAHARGASGATDDAGLVEALGVPVSTVEGHEEAFKVTTPLDLLLAEAVLGARCSG